MSLYIFLSFAQCGFLGEEATGLLAVRIYHRYRQWTYNVTSRRVRATIVAVGKQ